MALIELRSENVKVVDCGPRGIGFFGIVEGERVMHRAVQVMPPSAALDLATRWSKGNPFKDYAAAVCMVRGQEVGVIFMGDSPNTEAMLRGDMPIPYLGRRRTR